MWRLILTLNPAIQSILDDIIVNEEGGWKLTSDPNDNDGGWTLAGVTKATYESKFKIKCTITDIRQKKMGNIEDLKNEIYQIYYEEYYIPMNRSLPSMDASRLSCAINCGVPTALGLIRNSENQNDFINNWHHYYFNLIKKNAEAWRDYALYLEWKNNGGPATTDPTPVEKPKTLRAEYINGWYNRVERYRP